MKFTNHNMSETGAGPFTAIMAAIGPGVVAAQTAAIKGVINSRPLTMAVLLPATLFSAVALGYIPFELGRALLTGNVKALNPAHLEILGCALAIFTVVTTSLYGKAYKFGPGVFSNASAMIIRIGIIGGFAMAFVAGWLGYEKTAFYIASIVVIAGPLGVAEDLALMIGKHPVAAGQPNGEIEKYLWQGFPGFAAKICGWIGFSIITLRILIWLIYLRH
ncbi:hypothetical protein K2O51_31210 (plasmid) [Cupriavidus pinatubonensis]|uniref:hypothetical protein n=1 Tax=Cupriavidus pinatubonensis TaxID=248026 RepID=UPI001C73B273|nr:hypothetical protein [Cupriavidus pinatubonensis]QYY33714.1 hypothetical protein K2O51_31210 [Cupriavidus pinatubonensis]